MYCENHFLKRLIPTHATRTRIRCSDTRSSIWIRGEKNFSRIHGRTATATNYPQNWTIGIDLFFSLVSFSRQCILNADKNQIELFTVKWVEIDWRSRSECIYIMWWCRWPTFVSLFRTLPIFVPSAQTKLSGKECNCNSTSCWTHTLFVWRHASSKWAEQSEIGNFIWINQNRITCTIQATVICWKCCVSRKKRWSKKKKKWFVLFFSFCNRINGGDRKRGCQINDDWESSE